MKPLHLTYEAAQTEVPGPDVTLVLGEYHWKVHSELLIDQSPFFKKALEGKFKEASTKQISLHDDDPWIIARIIQYLYIDTWEVFQEYPAMYKIDPKRSNILDPYRIMKHNALISNYLEEKNTDAKRSCLEILIMVIDTADKYLMYDLINTTRFVEAWKEAIEKFGGYKLMDTLLKEVNHKRLMKYQSFKGVVADIVSRNVQLARHVEIQNWCKEDRGFGILSLQSCADQIMGYEKKIRDLEKTLSKSLEKPLEKSSEKPLLPAMKRKRPNWSG